MASADSAAARPAPVAALAVVVGVAALNLRPGITAVGPVLDTVTGHYGAGAGAAGIITAAPVFAFAITSLIAPLVLSRISVRNGLVASLALVGIGLVVRPWADLVVFVAGTFLAAIGVGLLAVLLPVVVRGSGRTGVLVTTFTTALQAGAVIGFAAVVPLTRVVGGWRRALTLWALLAVAAVVVVWRSVPARGRPHSENTRRERNPIEVLRRTRSIGLALFFGLQALVAFVVIGWLPSVLESAGVSASAAGGYLGVLTCPGVPISLLVPPLVAASAHPARWLAGFSVCTVAGVLGFLIAPGAAPLLWSLVLGVGLSVFSLALAVVTVRAGSTPAPIEFSSAVQGVGYLIAALGPYAVGVIRRFTDGWTVPLGVLLAVAILQTITAAACGRETKYIAPEHGSPIEARTVPDDQTERR
ncbi:MFS transporter [Nocardia macrotermitis]|uniref:Putative transporter YycB n=1 Tax=Nocardia macrotermitis TaxID=2585198 RepID=A0A7K0D936_9NOCA|nr:MFS transporter [Nocardia macrotermitis]MQY22237.1 putative transporter YycB [Nocardia macrotermitis]